LINSELSIFTSFIARRKLQEKEWDIMASGRTLQHLFYSQLQDVYDAEKQILKALPKMAKTATSDELRSAFQRHHDQTQHHVERLRRVFEMLDKTARGKACEAIQGIIEEGEEVMTEAGKGDVADAGLIAAAQAVEHYEIARYGTLKAWAKQLGLQEAVPLFEQTLEEEKETDKLLNKIALSGVNKRAA
jgi:ferritin-like metal-binding protein YciE